MKVEQIRMPNGETVMVVLIKCFDESVADNDYVRYVQDLYYGQNRLFLRKYRYETYPVYSDEDESWETHICGEPEVEILCDYVVIPEYEGILNANADSYAGA